MARKRKQIDPEVSDGGTPRGRGRGGAKTLDEGARGLQLPAEKRRETRGAPRQTKASARSSPQVTSKGKSGTRRATGTARKESKPWSVKSIIDQAEGADQYRTRCLEAAVGYLESGWSTMPVKDKRPTLRTWAPLTQQRFSAEQARKRNWPGVAIICGTISGRLVVLDIDGPQGRESIGELEIPPTVTAHTPNGLHYYFRWPEGEELPGPRVNLLPKVDVRAEASYVVAPPTVRSDGGQYAWDEGHAPGQVDIAEAPAWLLALAGQEWKNKEPRPLAENHQATQDGELIQRGTRNSALTSLAGSMRRRGMTRDEILAALMVANDNRCQPPLRAAEVRSIAESVAGRYNPVDPLEMADQVERDLSELLDRVERQKDVEALWRALPLLARLSPSQWGIARPRIKAALSNAIDLRELRSAISAEKKRLKGERPRSKPDRPLIMFPCQHDDAVMAAERALCDGNDPPVIYAMDGILARIQRAGIGGAYTRALNADMLRLRLSEVAEFRQGDAETSRDIPPPDEVVRSLLYKGSWPLPELKGVVETPYLRADGVIIQKPGYDPISRLCYVPRQGYPPFPVDDMTVEEARSLLLEIIHDFRFADAGSRANFIALLLTPLVRPAISGAVPIALISAPMRGSGKTLLASVVSTVATGMEAQPMAPTNNEEEMRKRITSVLRRGQTVIVLDNQVELLESAALATAVTATVWSDRLLGSNEVIAVPQETTWILTGNNVQIGGDLPRRCYWIEIDTRRATPDRHCDFVHPELLEWVTAERHRLVAAALVLARNWFRAGCPHAEVPVWGGFRQWADTLGGMLAAAGITGFLENLYQRQDESDSEATHRLMFLEAWWEAYGSKPKLAAEVVADLTAPIRGSNHEALLQYLPSAARDEQGAPNVRCLGIALATLQKTISGSEELTLERAGTRQRSALWQVRKLAPQRDHSEAEGE